MKFFGLVYPILVLFRNFENGQKIVKNHGLAFYFLVKLFDHENLIKTWLKTTQISGKRKFFGLIFHLLVSLRNFGNGRTIVKNHGLTPLHFGQIF